MCIHGKGTQGRCPSLRSPSDPQLEQSTSHRMVFPLALPSTSRLLSSMPTESQWVLGHWGSPALLAPIPTVPLSL